MCCGQAVSERIEQKWLFVLVEGGGGGWRGVVGEKDSEDEIGNMTGQ